MSLRLSNVYSMLGALGAFSLPSIGVAEPQTPQKGLESTPKVSGQLSHVTSPTGQLSLAEVSMNFRNNTTFRAVSLKRDGRYQFTDAEIKSGKFNMYYGRDYTTTPSSRLTATFQENRHTFLGLTHEDNK